MSDERDPEQKIRQAWDAKDFGAAATLALEAYADEIVDFLSSRLRSDSDAREAFSMFAEDLWTGLPRFGWRSSARTWLYALARNAANRYVSSPHNRARRHVALSEPEGLSQFIERARTATEAYRRTDVKDRIRALRERLTDDEQMLLVLRIDRDMAWRDIALAMHGEVDLSNDAVARESTRLRKVFERVKAELKRMAEAEGLLGPHSA